MPMFYLALPGKFKPPAFDRYMPHQFLIAAPSSGSGKTTVAAIGLLRALADRGLRVQPFECGPDFIDVKFHSMAAQRPAINLDTFMMDTAHVQETYVHYAHTADVSVIEGVMGLFDGAERMKGSSAEIATLLNVPVVLVVNARAMAYLGGAAVVWVQELRPACKPGGCYLQPCQ